MNKRENILSAALKLFVEQGEQATSMKWVAEEANCGIGTMYNYYSSKEELINELYLSCKKSMFSYISEAGDSKLSVRKRFEKIWYRYIDYAIGHQLESRFLHTYAHSPKISKEISDKVNVLMVPLLDVYEVGKKEGVIKDQESIQLLIFNYGAITLCVNSIDRISPAEKENLVLLAWDAIKS